MFILCDLISALTSCSENSPFGAVNGVLLVHRRILLKKKDITFLIYSITCSMYDYLAWIEVLRVVVSVLHLRVILQYRSSDSTRESREHEETFEWRLNYSRFADVEKKRSNFHWG